MDLTNSWLWVSVSLAIALGFCVYASHCGSSPAYDAEYVQKLEEQIESADVVIEALEQDLEKNREQIASLKRQRDTAKRKRARIIGEDLSNKSATEIRDRFNELLDEHAR